MIDRKTVIIIVLIVSAHYIGAILAAPARQPMWSVLTGLLFVGAALLSPNKNLVRLVTSAKMPYLLPLLAFPILVSVMVPESSILAAVLMGITAAGSALLLLSIVRRLLVMLGYDET